MRRHTSSNSFCERAAATKCFVCRQRKYRYAKGRQTAILLVDIELRGGQSLLHDVCIIYTRSCLGLACRMYVGQIQIGCCCEWGKTSRGVLLPNERITDEYTVILLQYGSALAVCHPSTDKFNPNPFQISQHGFQGSAYGICTCTSTSTSLHVPAARRRNRSFPCAFYPFYHLCCCVVV